MRKKENFVERLVADIHFDSKHGFDTGKSYCLIKFEVMIIGNHKFSYRFPFFSDIRSQIHSGIT